MMKKVYCWLLIPSLLMCLVVQSCSEDSEREERNSLEESWRYFPVKEGLYRTYQVDSVFYRELGTVRDTVSSWLRFEISELKSVADSDSIFDMLVLHRRSESDVWQHVATWQVEKSNERLIQNEGNARFVKLVFPLRQSMNFNGNVFISEDLVTEVAGEFVNVYRDWGQSRVLSTTESIMVNGRDFDQVAHIRLADIETLLALREVFEYYAKDLGLIRKTMRVLDTQRFGSNDPWEVKAERGFIMEMNLVDHN